MVGRFSPAKRAADAALAQITAPVSSLRRARLAVMMSFVLLARFAILLALFLPIGTVALPIFLPISAIALPIFLALGAIALPLLLALGAILLPLLLPLRGRRAVLRVAEAADGEQAAEGGGNQHPVHAVFSGWRRPCSRARIVNRWRAIGSQSPQ